MPSPTEPPDRLAAMRPSDIRQVHDMAEALAKRDPKRRIIRLHFGEPDLGTPPYIVEAACAALRNGAVFYENNSGRPDLKAALSAHHGARSGAAITPEHFVVTCGGMQAINLTLMGLVSNGDHVINITPAWPNFAQAAQMAGAQVRDVPLRFDPDQSVFHLDLDQLERAVRISGRVRMIMVASPSNPTGWVMSADEQNALVELCRRHDLYLLCDEMYDRIVFSDGPMSSMLRLINNFDRLILINGFSKTYCMTGWRLGYLITEPARAARLAQLQEFITSHAPSMAQVAAITALRDGEPFVQQSLDRYRRLRGLVLRRLRQIDGAAVARPDGSFYAFFSLPQSSDCVTFCRELLEQTSVVLAPGSAFGAGGEGWLRLCFANEAQLLEEAMDRLERFVQG